MRITDIGSSRYMGAKNTKMCPSSNTQCAAPRLEQRLSQIDVGPFIYFAPVNFFARIFRPDLPPRHPKSLAPPLPHSTSLWVLPSQDGHGCRTAKQGTSPKIGATIQPPPTPTSSTTSTTRTPDHPSANI